MTKRMLIDATHAEETRVVVLDGSRLEDYDVETSTKRQLKGNIYLAKIVRVEPSLQAAFVEYGGNRHGFLAFGEIHPDYYQLPVADRQRLLDMQEAEAREEEEAEDEAARKEARNEARGQRAQPAEILDAVYQAVDILEAAVEGVDAGQELEPQPEPTLPDANQVIEAEIVAPDMTVPADEADALFPAEPGAAPSTELGADLAPEAAEPDADMAANGHDHAESTPAEPPPEQMGGEADAEEAVEHRATPRFLRNYKIQEVIRRRQILLVQVVKEERGTKGAALTTYISLAGRFSVLMPNSPRGGGISRKITSAADRRRLKEVTAELDLPRGMGLIVRTAGANRPKPEIMRDGEYLLDQWDQIRDLTMKSTGPALIYEEANLIKRSIRDVYSRDVEDVLVDGEGGWRAARDFMRMLMPAHARKVQLWKEPQPLFAAQQVEAQLDAMLSPTVQLKSGGYLVINQTEALVAIDVNSGRSTRERGIEATALGTNLEAADEVARQLRLRDLAGLIVIDFIDMEARRSNGLVEARLKNALKNDRARIQVGSISHFGLLEMSRQRLRPSLAETSFVACPHCGGTGHVRSTESAALQVLRGIEEEGAKRRAAEVVVHVASAIALYILNHKRGRLSEIEMRYGMRVAFASDASLLPPQMRIDRVRALVASELPPPVSQIAPPELVADVADPIEEEEENEDVETAELDDAAEDEASEAPRPGETAEEGQRRRKRRRRRGRGRREDGAPGTADEVVEQAAGDAGEQPGPAPVEIAIMPAPPPAPESEPDDEEAGEDTMPEAQQDAGDAPSDDEARAKRRGRRGGRRRRRDAPEGGETGATPEADVPAAEPEATAAPYPAPAYPTPAYSGPTPADPFGGSQAFDIYDVMAQEEARREADEATSRLAPAHEPVAAEPVAEEPMAEEPVAAEPAAEPAGAPSTPDFMPELQPDAAPVLAQSDAEPVEKKRGWWRR